MRHLANKEIEIFKAALRQTAGPARRTFLDGACGADEPLRRRVEALIAMEDEAARQASAAGETDSSIRRRQADELEGKRVGPYKLLQRIGEGGCGVVYLAEQEEPVRRRVALKIIKLGMDTRAVIARFEAERQALALMDHPNIARVHDAGSTATGRPYFVMELVRGTKITAYCDEKQLATRTRLELFIQVCRAIQHAHQKGIIHRDIKPSNILVTLQDGVVAVPKVIDFGVAKATHEQTLTDKTLFTQYDQLIGTPAYMSPEQADRNSADVDTRSDIYSLGVLLYELLTGRTPFDAHTLATVGVDAMRKTIRETEPLRPSTRIQHLSPGELDMLARRHQMEAPGMLSMVQGDLDWIVLKAMEKDRNRRYETVAAFAEDVERYLANRPIAARPPSWVYRFGKMIQRNRLVVTAVGAFLVSLVAGLALSTWLYVQKRLAYEQVEQARITQIELREDAEARAYASEVRLIQQALERNNVGRARQLLAGLEPAAGRNDFRGWEWRYLWEQCRGNSLFKFSASTEPIFSLSASHDGRLLATTDLGRGEVAIWDSGIRQRVAALHYNPFNAITCFSPTGPTLAFSTERLTEGRRDFGVMLMDTRNLQTLRTFPLPGRCQGIQFSQDGRRLLTATGGTNGSFIVWRVEDGAVLSRMEAAPFALTVGTPFAVTPDLAIAAQGVEDGGVRVVDLRQGTLKWSLPAARHSVDSLAISPDGLVLAAGMREASSYVGLFDGGSGRVLGRLAGSSGYAVAMTFTPDGRTLCVAGSDQAIRLWSVAEQRISRILRGHEIEVWRLALLPDGHTLVSASKDGQVCGWDIRAAAATSERLRLPDRAWFGWRFSPDSASVFTCNEAGQVRRWAAPAFRKGELLAELGTNLVDVLIDSDCRQVAASFRDGQVLVWNLEKGEPRARWTAGSSPVSFWNFTRGGAGLVLLNSDDTTLHEWDIGNGRMLPDPADNRAWRIPTQFPLGRRTLRIGWRAPSPDTAEATNLIAGALGLPSLDGALSPDGRQLAFGHHLGMVYLVDAVTRHKTAGLGRFLQGVHSVAFSHDGLRLAAGSDGREAIKIWDLRRHQELVTLEGEGNSCYMTAFSRDGCWLGTLSANGDLDLWHAPSFEEIERATPAH